MFKFKAKKRLKIWKRIRKENEIAAAIETTRIKKIEEEKAEIRRKLMERYDLKDFHSRVLWYWSKDWIFSCEDEDNHSIDYKVGDILPYERRGDLIFFYKVTDINRKYGDYGMSDYGYFYDLTYNHYETIPQKIVIKKPYGIKWEKVKSENDKRYYIHGRVQGIRIVNLRVEDGRVEARYTCNIEHRSLPNYYDHYYNITEAKKDIQKKVADMMKDGSGSIKQFFIAPKLKKRK